jgi:hypothetical protein
MTILPRLLVAFLGVCSSIGVASAQDAGVVAVESVVSENPQPDGQTYLLSLRLHDGRQLSFQIPPLEAVRIVDGLSEVAGPGSDKRQVVALVQGMSIQADPHGKFVLLQPQTIGGPGDPGGGCGPFRSAVPTKDP